MPLSNSDVNDGIAVPAAYNNQHQPASLSKSNDTSQVVLAYGGFLIPPLLCLYPWVGTTSGGKEGGRNILARTSTHHLILYELIGYMCHLSQRVREHLGFHFPSRSREPVWHISYCLRRVYGTKSKKKQAEVEYRLRVELDERKRKIESVLPGMSWWRECGLRRGTASTMNAPGSEVSENWCTALSTRST